MLIGLTGGYCTGKNTVAILLERRGWTCIDVDRLGHEAVDLAKEAIVDRFGDRVLSPDGSVDRRAVASIVFSDERALADQEAIVHPVAIRLLAERISLANSRAQTERRSSRVCINAALLHRTNLIASCEIIIEVRAHIVARIRRGMRRDHLDANAALRRIAAQRRFRTALHEAARAHKRPVLVLRNSRDEDELERRLDRLLLRITLHHP